MPFRVPFLWRLIFPFIFCYYFENDLYVRKSSKNLLEKLGKTFCLISWHKNCFQKQMIKGASNITYVRNSTLLGANDNQDFLCEFDIFTIMCMFFLFRKLEWYISFHTSCILKNILNEILSGFFKYLIYLCHIDQIYKLLLLFIS